MHGERTAHGHQGDESRQHEEQPFCSSSARPCIRSFVKCGRHISLGDCALFQAGKALPYVGIIRSISINEEGAIQLAVNWLYRPADVKLPKGVPFEAAPNEIFYSFHKDSISAVSLLHPCKVAFLGKGVELPLGISSFVCRRVYDVANKRLWWLTDRDYTDTLSLSQDHQEEVNQLLDRTKLEMQAAVQSGVASPRALAGNPSSQQPKANSDNVPNSALSIAKNKKRERTDQNSEPSKRERSAKAEESEPPLVKRDRSMKADDVLAITDKDGGLFNLAGVDKLVDLMHQEQNDAHRKVVDVAFRRIMLAGIIAATEKEDCLNRFVQLGGLPKLDDWLQEAHKGKFGDGESPKEGEKVFEDLLITLLRALDRLPVDLDALKTCIVGKSVNNLRSHKNLEIQKKARKLVDIWKKRVDAEMKQSGDVKPGPSQTIAWSSRQQPQGGDSLTSHLGKNGVPPDVTLKNAKAISNGSSSSAEAITKAMIVSPVTGKICNLFSHNSPGTKDSHHAKLPNSSMPADVLSASVKEEKSSCSSQSQNYGPSWSSAPIKGTISTCWKDDARNSAVPLLNSKGAGSVLRSNGKALVGPNAPGSQKEICGGKPLVWSRNAVSDKATNPGVVPEKGVVETGHSEVPSNQRLIVRLPNPGRSPARTVSAGSMADSPVPSRGSSPSMQERHATSTPAEMADGKSRLLSNAQTEASAEAISELRTSTGGKGRATDGDAKQFDVPLEDKKENEKIIAKDSVQTALNCYNGEEKHLQNGKQIAGVNSCISTVSAQKTSTDGSTEADSSWKGDNSALAAHAVEDASRAVNATSMGVNDGAMSILATVAASEDVIYTGPDCGPGIGPRGADLEKQGIASLTPPGDTSNKNSLCGDKELRVVVGADDCRQVSHLSDPLATGKPGEIARNGAKILVCDTEAFPANLPSSTNDGINDSEKDISISRQSSLLDGEGKANATNQHGSLKDSPPGACVEASGKSMQFSGLKPDSANEKNGNVVDTSRIVQGADEGSAALDSCLEKSSRSGENIGSGLDDLSEEASEEQGRRDKESISGFPEEDALEVAWQVAKEVEQEMEKYNRPPVSGASSELEVQDIKLTVVPESTEKSGTVESRRSNPSDEDREKLNSEDKSAQFLGRQVTDATDNQWKLEEVNSGKLSNFMPSDEAKQFNVASIDDSAKNLQVDLKTSEASIPHLNQHLLSNAGQSVLRSSQLATQTVGASAQVISFGGSLSAASAHDSLKMEKARCNDVTGRPVFDLNEGLEDNIQEDSVLMATSFSAIMSTTVSVPSAISNGLTAPIAVVASTNGNFIPPASPLRVNKELGWKGSAATSAFRPAEPRRTPERQQTLLESPAADPHCGSTGKHVRPPLDIDLNVVDDRLVEDMGLTTFASQQTSSLKLGGHVMTSRDAVVSSVRLPSEGQSLGYIGARPDLDLNRADDSGDGVSDLRVPEIKSGIGTSLVTRNIVRDFDLNDGPMPSFEETGHDEPVLRHVPARSSGIPMMLSAAGLKMSGEMANITPWFPPGNSFPAVAIPAFPGSRGDPAYPVAAAQSYLNAGVCVRPFNNEIYRSGPTALSSSSAVAFPTAPPCVYPYSAFPFGASFPLSSASFGPSSTAFVDAASVSSYPSISSQMVAPGAVAPTFVRSPFLMNMPEGTSADSSGVWGRLNLDLNAGPEGVDTDAGNVRHPFILSGQVSIEDQMRAIRQVGVAPGAALKRKEPEGGLEVYRSPKHAWR
ncbi:hypothetical protein O6H91_14G045400 [Diphasiastrum complanatum]|uniref:Uncharacterized protein n=1 Tax=Diphasiastrum complanatum TaxID=34168 RepID=A0ACC2BPY9_DIPCM|nr:hypothetical protein O6H91_14G045400 [Diphasiastrum complanatum]